MQQFENIETVAFKWLKACGYKPFRPYIQSKISSHPDYPALTAIVDLLEEGNMDYNAVHASMENAGEFIYPLIAHVKTDTNGQGFVLAASPVAWQTNLHIQKNWTGIILMPEKNAQWQHKENEALQVAAKQNNTRTFAALFILTFLIVIFNYPFTSTVNFFFSLLSLFGLVISWFTFAEEAGYQNKVIKQVCQGLNPEGGCSQVLNSKQAKGISGITPAIFSLAYFTAQYCTILLNTLSAKPAFALPVFYFSLLAVSAAAWSLYTQKFIVKQWCALCLGIVAIIVAQFIITLLLLPLTFTIRANEIYGAALFAIAILIWQPIKKLLIASLQKTGCTA